LRLAARRRSFDPEGAVGRRDAGARSFPPGTWEILTSFPATQQDAYIVYTSTLADSTASGTPYAVYVVTAHTTTPSEWYACPPDSGYSVDNIAPGVPGGSPITRVGRP
jgi:hypothetical protein